MQLAYSLLVECGGKPVFTMCAFQPLIHALANNVLRVESK